jgi:hypothetical protein
MHGHAFAVELLCGHPFSAPDSSSDLVPLSYTARLALSGWNAALRASRPAYRGTLFFYDHFTSHEDDRG